MHRCLYHDQQTIDFGHEEKKKKKKQRIALYGDEYLLAMEPNSDGAPKQNLPEMLRQLSRVSLVLETKRHRNAIEVLVHDVYENGVHARGKSCRQRD